MKKKLWTISPLVLATPIITIACANNSDKQPHLKDIVVVSTSSNNALISIQIDNLLPNKTYNLEVKLSNGISKHISVNSNKAIKVTIDNLTANTTYHINSILLDSQNIINNNNQKITFTTKKSDDQSMFDFNVATFNVLKTDANSASVVLDFIAKNFRNNNVQFKVVLNNDKNYDATYVLDGNKIRLSINASGLSANTSYYVKSILLVNQEQSKEIYKNSDANKFAFQTTSIDTINPALKSVNISDITKNSANLNVAFNNLQANTQYNLKIKFTNGMQKDFLLTSQNATFLIDNLQTNTTYQIAQILLNNQEVITSDNQKISFKTLDDMQTNQPQQKEHKFNFDNAVFKTSEITTNSANASITFNSENFDNSDENSTFKVILNNDQIYNASYNVIDLNQIKLTVNATNLKANTNYFVKSILFSNGSSKVIYTNNYSNKFSFKTKANPILRSIKTTDIKSHSVNLSLDLQNLEPNKEYNLKIRFKSGFDKDFVVNNNTSSYQISDLAASSTYHISQILLNNIDIITSESQKISFTTLTDSSNNPESKPNEYHFDFNNAQFSSSEITTNSANLSLNIQTKNFNTIKPNLTFKLILSNDYRYNATYQILSPNQLKLNINADNLSENTSYFIKSISYNEDNQDHLIYSDSNNKFNFKTLSLPDQVTNVNIYHSSLLVEPNSNANNQVDVTINNIKDIYQNKSARIVLTKNGSDIYSSEITLNNATNYTFTINNLSNGTYTFKNFQVNINGNWKTFENSFSGTYSFTVTEKQPQKENTAPVSNNDIKNYGNIFTLQNANLISGNDLNINTSNDFHELNKDTLKTKDSYYPIYFNYLDAPTTKTSSNDTENKYTQTSNVDVSSINVTNDTITINITNTSEGITSAKALVKSFDQYNPWVKYIDLSVNSNQLSFNANNLSNYQNDYIITQLVINNNKVATFNLQSKYKFSKKNNSFDNLMLQNFDIYKNQNTKEIFATASFNWTTEQVKILSDKVFVFYFEVEKKVYKEEKKTDFPFGPTVIVNKDQAFDVENAVPASKKIYIPFKDLSKFSLAAFQEQIKYKLKYIDVVNNKSYLNFIPRKEVTNKNIEFSYNFDWTSENKLKNQLDDGSSVSKVKKYDLLSTTHQSNITFSPENFNAVLDYNFDYFNWKTRYKNSKENHPDRNYTITKNNIAQKIHWFKTREYLNDSIFKLSENDATAIISEDLNSIIIPSDFDKENIIFWFVFELDLNPREFKDANEFDNIHSRVRVPVSLKTLQENQYIDDVDFMYDYVSETPAFQQSLYSKIKSNIKFSLSLTNNQLTLKLHTRNNNIHFNNILATHNHSTSRSAFISRNEFFVNWIQNETDTDEKIKFKQAKKLDKNSIQGSSIGYKNTYELKTHNQTVQNIEARNNILDDAPAKDDRSKRLYKEDSVKPIEEGRSRVFSLNADADGTWNIFAKVNDNPNDFRYYAFVNFHVWNTNRHSGIGTWTQNHNGYERIVVQHPKLISSTNINRPTQDQQNNKYLPIYTDKQANNASDDTNDKKFTYPKLTPDGDMFDFEISSSEQGITFDLFLDFSGQVQNSYGNFKNTDGEIISRSTNNNLDAIVAIVDFKPIFTTFDGKDLDTYKYKERLLTQHEKNAIKHFLNFKNLKPLNISDLSLYLSSFNNLNFYIATLPKVVTLGNQESYPGLRYREYLIGNNPIKYYGNDKSTIDAVRPALWGEVPDFDWGSGSSGSGVYDSDGNVVGLDKQAGNWGSNNFLVFDTQKYAYLKNRGLPYNPTTFEQVVKKMAYLYPDQFKDIFK
ncbi:hypothetical protein ACR82Z_01790 [Mycoplasma sp. 6243]|uniref:hypothetical protein n=1 Tax=Mycoplasma sp. 6243 TaxID=3440865 RepID=UPI003EBE5272